MVATALKIDDIPNVGIGLYSFPEAARIIGVKSSTLRRWATEYSYRNRGTEYVHVPIIARYFGAHDSTLTFVELIELLFVNLFHSQGISLYAVRRASEKVADYLQMPHPFAVKQFGTDGARIFAILREEERDQELIEDLSKGQLAFPTVVRPFFRKLDYADSAFASQYWPLGREGRVVLDPRRRFGGPIDAATGVPTEVLYDAVNAGKEGQSPEIVARWFEVPIEAVHAAVQFEQSLRGT